MADARLKKAGVSGYNKPKRTPSHKTKSHVVVAKSGGKIKTIRFGQQGKLETKRILQGLSHLKLGMLKIFLKDQ